MKEKISVSRVKMIFGLMALCVWALVLVSAFVVAKALRINRANRLIPIFHRGVLRCFNLCCVVEGDPAVTRPTLYICNHISYLIPRYLCAGCYFTCGFYCEIRGRQMATVRFACQAARFSVYRKKKPESRQPDTTNSTASARCQ